MRRTVEGRDIVVRVGQFLGLFLLGHELVSLLNPFGTGSGGVSME